MSLIHGDSLLGKGNFYDGVFVCMEVKIAEIIRKRS